MGEAYTSRPGPTLRQSGFDPGPRRARAGPRFGQGRRGMKEADDQPARRGWRSV